MGNVSDLTFMICTNDQQKQNKTKQNKKEKKRIFRLRVITAGKRASAFSAEARLLLAEAAVGLPGVLF